MLGSASSAVGAGLLSMCNLTRSISDVRLAYRESTAAAFIAAQLRGGHQPIDSTQLHAPDAENLV